MGMGFCCCGDEAPPGPSSLSSSRSSVPRTVSCSSCPGVLLPETLTLTIVPIDGFGRYLDCNTLTNNVCLPLSGGGLELFSNPPNTLYSHGSSSCGYSTECVTINPKGNKQIVNGCKSGCNSFECEDSSIGPQTIWLYYIVGTGIAYSIQATSSPPAAQCPSLTSRVANLSVMQCYTNISFSCDPFYHEFTCAFQIFHSCGSGAIITPPGQIPPFCEGCCISISGNWYMKMKVIIS